MIKKAYWPSRKVSIILVRL